MSRRRNRKHSKIDQLAPSIKLNVEEMIVAGFTYHEIVTHLKTQGVEISQSSIHRYAKSYMATVAEIKAIQENYRAINEELSKTPELDITEATLQVLGQKILNVSLDITEDDLRRMDPKDLLTQANKLVAATTRKRRAEAQSRNKQDSAVESAKVELYETIAKERPDLWQELNRFLETKRGDLGE
jgi:hypothetical protein